VSLNACAAYARRNYYIFTATVDQINYLLSNSGQPSLESLLPKEVRDFKDVFLPKEAKKLPPHRPHDYNIRLLEGKTPPFGPLYAIS
jgi:hypothetical protein